MKNLRKFILSSFLLSSIVSANPLWDIQDGIKLYREQNYKEAENFFIGYLNNNLNDEDGYFWLGKTYKKLQQNEKNSKENFKKTYELFVDKRDIEKNLLKEKSANFNFEDYFDMALMYFETGKYSQALYYADLMLKINPESYSAYFIKAKIAFLLNELDKAKENLNKAITYNDSLLASNLAKSLKIYEVPEGEKELYYNLAWEKYFEGELKESVKNLEKYLKKDSSNIDMMNFLAELYLKDDEIDLAKEIIDKVKEANPNNIQNILNEAKIAKIENKTQEIEPLLLQAYKINPNNENVLAALANYYSDKKDYLNSKKYYENLISINNECFEWYFGYVYSLIQLNQRDLALNSIRKMIELNSNAGDIQFLLAQISIREGNFKEALESLYEAIRKDDNYVYYLELAQVNNILGKYNQSNVNLQDALNIKTNSKNDKEIDELFIRNYVKSNDLKNAKNYFNGLQGLDKDSIIYKYNLYIIYKLEGSREKQEQYCNQLKKVKPVFEEDYIILSDFLYENNDYKRAIKILNDGMKKNPNYFELQKQKIKLDFLYNQN